MPPNLIWPGLRLRIPLDSEAPEPTADETPVEAAPTPVVSPFIGDAPDRQDHPAAQEAPVGGAPPMVPATAAPTSATSETALPSPGPTLQPVEQVRTDSGQPTCRLQAPTGA